MMVVEVEALIREPVKNYLADFFPLRGGGVPLIPLRVFGQNDFPLGGGAQWAKSGGEAFLLQFSDFTKDPKCTISTDC